MFGNDSGAADVVVTTLVQHAHRRSFSMPADHRGLRVAVDDGIAHDMDAKTVELFERRPQRIEGEALAFHEGEQLFIPDRRWRCIRSPWRRNPAAAARCSEWVLRSCR